MKLRLHSRISVIVAGLIAVVVPALALVLSGQFDAAMERARHNNEDVAGQALFVQAEKRAFTIAGLVAEAVANDLYGLRLDDLRDVGLAAMDQPGVESLIVFDAEARVVFDGTEKLRRYGETLSDAEVLRILAGDEAEVEPRGDILKAVMPVHLGTMVIGGVQLDLRLDDIHADMAEANRRINTISKAGRAQFLRVSILATLVLAATGAFVGLLLARDISAPIEILAGLAREIGRGRYRIKVPFRRHDEIGQLARAFEIMAREREAAEEHAQRLQEELAQTARRRTADTLTGELAHELGQPLLAIRNYGQGCLRRLARGEIELGSFREAVDAMVAQAERASGVVERVRRLARREPLLEIRDPVDVNGAVSDALALLRPEASRCAAEVVLEMAPERPRVRTDRIGLQQVVTNLAQNAFQAMENAPFPRRLAVRTALGEGNVEICIADTGPGIPQESREHIFEPFFTTKDGGMGLGLAICRSIAESLGGRLWAEAAPEGGAAFRLVLPAANSADSRAG